jgi:hypothetical protein
MVDRGNPEVIPNPALLGALDFERFGRVVSAPDTTLVATMVARASASGNRVASAGEQGNASLPRTAVVGVSASVTAEPRATWLGTSQ